VRRGLRQEGLKKFFRAGCDENDFSATRMWKIPLDGSEKKFNSRKETGQWRLNPTTND
jgi:hypothetical protein